MATEPLSDDKLARWRQSAELSSSLDSQRISQLIHEIDRLKGAIREHRDQKSDDRCWEDDQRLYTALGDGNLGDNRVGDKTQMLLNCSRFLNQRCADGGWLTYKELEATNGRLREALELLTTEEFIDGLRTDGWRIAAAALKES